MNDRNNIENQIQDALGSEGSRELAAQIFDHLRADDRIYFAGDYEGLVIAEGVDLIEVAAQFSAQDSKNGKDLPNFEIIFDNGGGATLQVGVFDDYVHHYDDMAQLAQDVAALVGGADVSDWEGNEPECLITDDEYFKYSPNGGYTALDQDNYLDSSHAESGWNNVRQFAEAIQALQTV